MAEITNNIPAVMIARAKSLSMLSLLFTSFFIILLFLFSAKIVNINQISCTMRKIYNTTAADSIMQQYFFSNFYLSC